MISVPASTKWIVVWVPGTWGDDVHEGFFDACSKVINEPFHCRSVKYQADADFEASVKAGVEALGGVLRELDANRTPDQKIIVAGSSQGAWVIHEAMTRPWWRTNTVYRVATYGLPGMSQFKPRRDDFVWDMTSPFDAVTWEWNGPEGRVIKNVSQFVRGRVWYLIPVLPWMVLNPRPTLGMIGLLMTHFRTPRLSPHDYTPQMPLTVKWLTN